MNAEQSREYTRSRELSKFLIQNEETCALLPPFSKVREEMLANNTSLNKYTPIKTINGKGVTKEKGTLKTEVATEVNSICKMTTSYAVTTGDKALANSVKYRTSDVIRLKDSEVLGLVNGLVSVITPLLDKPEFKDYTITQDTLKRVTDLATAFDNSIGEANIIDSNTSIAGKNIDSILKDIRGNVTQFNLLIDWFENNHPDFVTGYRTAAAIDQTGIHHSGVRGIITNSLTGELVEDATVILQGKKNTKSTLSGEDGDFEISKFRAGKCKLIISTPGYDSQTIPVTILRGKILQFSISLEAQVVKLAATA